MPSQVGNPWHALFQLQRLSHNVPNNLSKIRVPCLVLHAYRDDIAHRRNSYLIYDRVGGSKCLIWLYNS
jgi:carboxylesterase